jgi:RNA polymerase sigma-70 factor, ECF subfamily
MGMVSETDSVSSARIAVSMQRMEATRSAAFEAIYRLYHRDVYRYILAMTGSIDDAEDITSDTFERAARAWTIAESPPDAPLAWLLVASRRRVTDRWRQARRRAQLVLGGQRSLQTDPPVERTEFWLWFDAVARVLTSRQREVLLLRYQHDLTDNDIARIMSLSTSGVRSLVNRAIEVLRNHPEVL